MVAKRRQLAAEALGSAILTGVVIGSGILAAELAGGAAGLARVGNTLATSAILFVLILCLGPVSGAHFNPVVSAVMAWRGELTMAAAFAFAGVQILGCLAGAAFANLMFDRPALHLATTDRSGLGPLLGEAAATGLLVLAILGARRHGLIAVAAAVSLVIAAGYWWTASTSFANPAITVARAFSDTFAGIRPADAPGFVAAQCFGAALAAPLSRWLFGD
jgi:glycerol uptake facilitator-like aquaporin